MEIVEQTGYNRRNFLHKTVWLKAIAGSQFLK